MDYQSFTLKYRPRVFEDVVGQEHVSRTIKNAVTAGKIHHAYLFTGPRGTGKTTTARVLARALNCLAQDGPTPNPCGVCSMCLAIGEGRAMDITEIDAASNNSVEDIRELREKVKYSPAEGRAKMYILDEVHMLSTGAFNALLKTLEEPPAHAYFALLTTELHKIPETIVSRCQRFDLKPIPSTLIAQRLRLIADKEKVKVTDEALRCIARMADGGMRDAQSILDQMISFCGADISEPDVLDVYGLVSAERIAELAAALAAGDHRRMIEIIDRCDEAGRDLVRLLSDLQAFVREALLEAIAKGGETDRLGSVLTTEQLTRMLDALREGETSVKLGLAEKINFEVTLLKAVESSRSRSIDSLIKELTALADEAPVGAGEAEDGSKKKP